MSRTGKESDEQTRACGRALLLEGPLEDLTSVEVTATEGMPDDPYRNVEAAKACHERIESGRSRPLEVRCANIPLAWIPTTTGDLPGEHVESLLGLHFVDPTG